MERQSSITDQSIGIKPRDPSPTVGNAAENDVQPEEIDEAKAEEVKQGSDVEAPNLTEVNAEKDAETENEDEETRETVITKPKRKRMNVTRPKRSEPQLPDDTMYDLCQDADGNWYSPWAHLDLCFRRLRDPERAKPDDPVPYQSRVDDTTCVTGKSNRHDNALNVE